MTRARLTRYPITLTEGSGFNLTLRTEGMGDIKLYFPCIRKTIVIRNKTMLHLWVLNNMDQIEDDFLLRMALANGEIEL